MPKSAKVIKIVATKKTKNEQDVKKVANKKKSKTIIVPHSMTLADSLVLNSETIAESKKKISKKVTKATDTEQKIKKANKETVAKKSKFHKESKIFETILHAHHHEDRGYVESLVQEIDEEDASIRNHSESRRSEKRLSNLVRQKYNEGQKFFSDNRSIPVGSHHEKLRKRPMTLAVLLLTLLIVVGVYISPKSSAESVIFYPTSCLGGWTNPHNVEGIPQVDGNKEEDKFTEENSAILIRGTNADIYCGGFSGQFKKNTKPSKVIVALSWSKGKDTQIERAIIGDSFASSSAAILDSSASSSVSFTLATTTESIDQASSTEATTTPSTDTQEKKVPVSSGDSDSGLTQAQNVTDETPKKIDLQPASDTSNQSATTAAPDVNQMVPTSQAPLSLRKMFVNTFLAQIGGASVYADEVTEQPTSNTETTQVQTDAPSNQSAEQAPTATNVIEDFLKKTDDLLLQKIEIPNISNTTSTELTPATPLFDSSSTSSADVLLNGQPDVSTSSAATSSGNLIIPVVTPSVTQGNQTQHVGIVSNSKGEDESENNFLQVLYTFDGITWSSLGNVNEESIVYRTFEIPLTATTSWDDLSKVQIKVQSLGRIDPTPTIYLDGIKVEVLYDTPTIHEHPDFSRDTVLKETTEGTIRVANIINSDTNNKEIWYIAPRGEGGLATASSTWVKLDQEDESLSYRLVELYEKNLFWVDDIKKNLWTIDLDKNVTNSVPISADATTTVPFTRANGEPWAFDYNPIKKIGVLHFRVIPPELKTSTIIKVDGNVKVKKLYDGTQNETLVITPPGDGNISTYSDEGTIVEYIAVSEEPHSVSIESLPLGISVLLFTTRVDGCASLSLIECKFDHRYSGEVKVLVTNGVTATSTITTTTNEP